MSGYARNSGKKWSIKDLDNLQTLIKQNTPIVVISLKLGRTKRAIRNKIIEVKNVRQSN